MSPKKPRGAFTLLEVMIALAIFSVLSMLATQAIVNTVKQHSLAEAEDDVNRDGARAIQTITQDLAESGWAFPDTNPLDSTSFAADRGLRYFPFVQQELTAIGLNKGRGTLFPHTYRDYTGGTNINMVLLGTLPPQLPGAAADATTDITAYPPTQAQRDAYYASFRARSQELLFLRQVTTAWTANPTTRSPTQLDFNDKGATLWSTAAKDYSAVGIAARQNLGILMPSGWIENPPGSGNYEARAWDVNNDGIISANEGVDPTTKYPIAPYGRPMVSGELSETGDMTLAPLWETIDPPDYQASTSDAVQPWREYQYAVIPSPAGLGRLVRAYKVLMASVPAAAKVRGPDSGQFITPTTGTYGMCVEKVLSDNVVRIMFDTYRTDPTLDVNSVRVRLYMARQEMTESQVVIYRIFETIVCMQAKPSDTDRESDRAQLVTSLTFDY